MEPLSVTKTGSPRSSRFESMEFRYDSEFPSNSTTPYVSAPSSPGRGSGYGGFYFSAPTSPTRSAAILSEFAKSTRAVVPFVWEEKPGIPKKNGGGDDCEEFGSKESSIGNSSGNDFEFSARFTVPDGGLNSEGFLSSADELFCNGQIRPLRLPPRLQQPAKASVGIDCNEGNKRSFTWFNASSNPQSPRSPRSPRSPIKEGRRILKEAFAGFTKGNGSGDGDVSDFDPFMAAINEARKEERGRERSISHSRRTRSLSPLPLRIFHWDEEPRKSDVEEFFSSELEKGKPACHEEVKSSVPEKPKASKRWSLKDFLFRSASEGRAQSKDRLWGLSIAPAKQSEKHVSSEKCKLMKPAEKNSNSGKKQQEDFNSFNTKSSSGKRQEDAKNYCVNPRSGGSFTKSGRKMPISPHELHYTANRAQSEEMKKKTFLPYRQGLLGCLGFTSKGYTAMNGLTRSLNTVS